MSVDRQTVYHLYLWLTNTFDWVTKETYSAHESLNFMVITMEKGTEMVRANGPLRGHLEEQRINLHAVTAETQTTVTKETYTSPRRQTRH